MSQVVGTKRETQTYHSFRPFVNDLGETKLQLSASVETFLGEVRAVFRLHCEDPLGNIENRRFPLIERETGT